MNGKNFLREPLSKRDSRVRFQDDIHKYFVDGVQMSYSVTQLIHEYFSDFDSEEMCKKMLERDDFTTNERYEKYWGFLDGLDLNDENDFKKAYDLILANWEENRISSSGLGTDMHQAIEDYIVSGKPLPDNIECLYFTNFHNSMLAKGYIPFRSEQIVFDIDLDIAGSADMMYTTKEWLKEKPTRVYLIDWKRSKEIRQRSFYTYQDGEKIYKVGKGVCSRLEDCNLQHYTLQLNMYKYLLEKHYPVVVEKMAIVVFHPVNKKWLRFMVRNKSKTAKRVCAREGLTDK